MRNAKIRSGLTIALALATLITAAACTGPNASAPRKTDGETQKRDIYYIVLEDYGGPRTLKEMLGYDASDLFQKLRSLGFYVAEDSTSNYPNTGLSLASSLNMDYVHKLLDPVPTGEAARSQRTAHDLIKGPKLARFLKDRGYKYVHIGGWWGATSDDPYADVNFVFDPRSRSARETLKGTAALRLLESSTEIDKRVVEFARVQYQVTMTVRARELFDQPTYTFTHFLIPHPPYVFRRDGSFLTKTPTLEGVRKAFYDQLLYTNDMVIELLKQILSGPEKTRPIIVVQTDEGPHHVLLGVRRPFTWSTATLQQLRGKFPILNAYYLPGVGKGDLYPTITPVNSFRLILDRYFGAGLPLLPDRNYIFPDWEHFYTAVDVTKKVR